MLNYIENAKKLSNAIAIIAKVIRVFTIIGFVFVIIGSVTLLSMPKDSFVINVDNTTDISVISDIFTEIEDIGEDDLKSISTQSGMSVTLDGNELGMSANINTITINNYSIGVGILNYALELAASYVIFLFVGKLFKSISESPIVFTDGNYNLIKQLGIALIACNVIPGILSSIINTVMGDSTGIFDISVSINLDTVIYVLLYIIGMMLFKYAVEKNNENTVVTDNNIN